MWRAEDRDEWRDAVMDIGSFLLVGATLQQEKESRCSAPFHSPRHLDLEKRNAVATRHWTGEKVAVPMLDQGVVIQALLSACGQGNRLFKAIL